MVSTLQPVTLRHNRDGFPARIDGKDLADNERSIQKQDKYIGRWILDTGS